MLLVALTGGLATGKSRVGKVFVELGCHLIQADELGHIALASQGEAYAPTVAEFGSGILSADGSIDRKALAAIVFNHPEKLQKLNAIVHPAVERLRLKQIETIQLADPRAIILVEAAIHIETGGYKRYEKLILAVCGREEQIRRAMKRDHSSREEVLSRIDRQMSIDEKRKFADYVIDTSGDEANTLTQTVEVYNQIKKL